MLVGNCNRLAICLDTGVDYEFTLYTEYWRQITTHLRKNWGRRKNPVSHNLQNVVTNLCNIVLHSLVMSPDSNRPAPIPRSGLTWLSVYLTDTCLKAWVLLIPLSHTLESGSLCSGTFSTSLITNCSKVLLFCNSTAFVGKSQALARMRKQNKSYQPNAQFGCFLQRLIILKSCSFSR